MRKMYSSLSLLIVILLFSSCEKQDLPTISNGLTLKTVRLTVENEDFLRRATFTEEGKIRNVILGLLSTSELDGVVREYIYTNSNLLECIPGISSSDAPGCYPFLEYSNDLLTSLNGNPLEYNGNTITELNLTHDGRTIYEFADQTYSQLLKVEYIQDVSSSPILADQTTFTYEGDNVVYIERKRIDDATGELELIHKIEYTYDNQPNPYQEGHNQIALVTYYQQMLYLQGNEFNMVFRSANNIIDQQATYYNSSGITTAGYSYTFEYNDNGYPTKSTRLVNGIEYVVEYEYYE